MSYSKKPEEIKQITEGGKRMGEILEELVVLVKPGTSAYEIDQRAEALIKKAGGRPAFKGYRSGHGEPPFPSTICASVNDEVVHGIAHQDKILKDGDIFTIDIGMEYPFRAGQARGYFTDTAVTVPVGEADKEAQQLMSVTQEALEAGIEEVRVGNSIAAIGKAIQKYVEPYGYGIVRDLVGHGVGYAVHEDPRIPNYYDRDLEDWIIKPGLVVALEPMITAGDYRVKSLDDHWTIVTVDGSRSAHFEHTVVATNEGPVVVTRRPHELHT